MAAFLKTPPASRSGFPPVLLETCIQFIALIERMGVSPKARPPTSNPLGDPLRSHVTPLALAAGTCDTVRAMPNFAKLCPTLVETSVICLSSVMHHLGGTDWEGAAGGHRGRMGGSTYADSKLAMVLLAKVRISLKNI